MTTQPTSLARSHLEYLQMGRVDSKRPVLLLHDTGGGTGELDHFGAGLKDDRLLIAPSGFYGVYGGLMALKSRQWFLEWPGESGPEPASFGRSLTDIEALLLDLYQGICRQCPPPIVFGIGQGATIALALVSLVPELLGGALLVDGRLTHIDGWEPQRQRSEGLLVSLRACETTRAQQEAVASHLMELGARTDCGATTDPYSVFEFANWLSERGL